MSEVQRQVAAAFAASSATLEATKRRSDRVLRRQLLEIEDLQIRIVELEASDAVAAGDLEVLRDELAREQERFVAELAERDRVYAEEIATYCRVVEDIAATPEGLAALERFNAGQEAEALAILDRLRAARDLAAARRTATLEVAVTDRQRSVAFTAFGNVAIRHGDLDAALETYARGLEVAERLATADPSNALAQRDIIVSLYKLSNLASATGRQRDAERMLKRALDVNSALIQRFENPRWLQDRQALQAALEAL